MMNRYRTMTGSCRYQYFRTYAVEHESGIILPRIHAQLRKSYTYWDIGHLRVSQDGGRRQGGTRRCSGGANKVDGADALSRQPVAPILVRT